jgi:hypothetical protein
MGMELRLFLMPLFGMALCGLIVFAFTMGRRDAAASAARLPMAWFAMLGLGFALIASGALSGHQRMVVLSDTSIVKAGALALVVLAAGLVLVASRTRRRADTLVGSAPLSIDEAVAALREGRSPGWGVYKGKLGAGQTLTSPSGLECAFYDAEVRAVMPDGSRGSLLSTEKAYAELVTLRGERAEVAVSVAPSMVMAPVNIRRCEQARLPVPSDVWEKAEGHALEALSWERAGRVGESCLVVGELLPGPAQGSYVLRGRDGGPAMLVLGNEGLGSGEVLSRKAWRMFAAAGALSVAAAFVLSRSF